MGERFNETPKNYSEDASKDVLLKIPALTLGTLLNMIAISKRVICDGSEASSRGLCRAVHFMEQLVYEQCYEKAGADEVWKNFQDGTYHHPTFPEMDGEAWTAMEHYDEEVFALKLIEMATRILGELDKDPKMDDHQHLDECEHALLDVLESEGCEGVLRLLMGQENS